jgi:L-serine dehydratase
MISVFELFSVGIGPSSSHTVGPMRAARDFLVSLAENVNQVHELQTHLFGSLAFTGAGHGTDKAILLGFMGETPEGVDPDSIELRLANIHAEKRLNLLGQHEIAYIPSLSIFYNYQESFEYHPNAIRFEARDVNKQLIKEAVYFSVGGGFIVNQADLDQDKSDTAVTVPFPFQSGADLLRLCETHGFSIADLMLHNEAVRQPIDEVREKLLHIAQVMLDCIHKGCHTEGILPGKLGVKRRASRLYTKLMAEGGPSHADVMRWLNVYALAVNEENAAGGRVVTAPTNGAAGIVPAVLHYYKTFCDGTDDGVITYLLTAGAIGILYKMNASISGAEMGCQGEVGVACSMAAAGLAAALKGTPLQVENAAEIGMEHNLGLTCDPVGGLVQIPCIERNAIASVKAVNSAQLALSGDGSHKVSLDMVISTMREIGQNMNSIYKETSLGGLAIAVNLADC